MKTFVKLFITALLLCYWCNGFAQIKANVNQLAFMTGTWTQQHKWGDMEEYWSQPFGDNMMSSFRITKDGKAALYEFVIIEQTGDVPVMKMRHFNKGSIGWEEKDKPFLLPLVKITKDQADFESTDKTVHLIYKRVDAQKMDVILNEKDKDGKLQKDVFNYMLKHKAN